MSNPSQPPTMVGFTLSNQGGYPNPEPGRASALQPPVDTQLETSLAFLQKRYGLDHHEISVIRAVIISDRPVAAWHLQQIGDE